MTMLTNIGNELMSSFSTMWDQIVLWFPNVLGALIVLLVGGWIAKMLRQLTVRVFDMIKVEMLADKVQLGSRLRDAGLNVTVTQIFAGLVYWLVYLIFVSSAASVLGVDVVTSFINRMIGYIPAIFAGLVVMVIGVMVADTLSKMMENVKLGDAYKTVVRWFVLVIAFITAIQQIGIDVSFLTANIQILVAGAALALGIAFGLGGKDMAKDFLEKNMR